YVASLERPGQWIRSVSQLPKARRIARGRVAGHSVQDGLSSRAKRRTQSLRQVYRRLARFGSCHADNDLPGGDELARLCQRFHHRAVGIGHERCVRAFVLSELELRFGGRKQRARAIGGGLDLIVSRL